MPISEIRIKEDFKPKTKDVAPKMRSSTIKLAAQQETARQLIDKETQRGEGTDPSMQEVDHAAVQTVSVAHTAAEQGRDAFQRRVQRHRQVKAEQKQFADRFQSHPSNPSSPQIRSSNAHNTTIVPKQKPTAYKTTSANPVKTAGSAKQPKTRSLRKSTAGAKKVAEQGRRKFKTDAQRKMAAQAKQAAKRTAEGVKNAALAAAKVVKAILGALAGGGIAAVPLAVFLLVAVVAAVVASPFGVFFSDSGSDTVPLSTAVAQINAEYCNELMRLQAGNYDEIVLEGSPPDWAEVVAVFACDTASDSADAMDVATLDDARIRTPKGIFWEMCEITSEERTVTNPNTATTLIIRISGKTAEEMRTEKNFSDYQNAALDSMLAERASLRQLLGDLTLSDETAARLWRNLPPNLSNVRRQVLRHALSLVGKVNYFWGGKSLALGWDNRWGQLQKVWAAGSETTGTYRPYGLDCSGFVDWVFYNASGGTYIIGHGGGVTSQHAYCAEIPWSEAQPGDLAFYPDNSHIGIVGGWDENGNLQIIHCTASVNGITISGKSGFSAVGRPTYYGVEQ